jgi:cysteine-rich repeat protein
MPLPLIWGCVGGIRLEGDYDGGRVEADVADLPDVEGDAGTDADRSDDAPDDDADGSPDDGAEATDVGDDADGSVEDGAPARCGDGVRDDGEECDDGNAVAGDGCEADCRFSCRADAECRDGEACRTVSCEADGTGRRCVIAVAGDGTPCDDGWFCTAVDACTDGRCVGVGAPCAGCDLCDESLDRCVRDPHACLIDGACWAEGALNPDNDCEACRPAVAPASWARLPDFTPCLLVTTPDRSYDICSGGVCVSPGCGDVSCNPPGPHFPPADTGQRLCYTVLPVSCTGADGRPPCDDDGLPLYCGQDADYGWDTRHSAAERFARHLTTPGQPTVTDEVTGLEWQGCVAGLSGDSCADGSQESLTWHDAVRGCDALSWGGREDWRLPDPHELHSIIDYGVGPPRVDPAAFPATPSTRYWSVSFAPFDGAWALLTSPIPVWAPVEVAESLGARCVRGGGPLAVDARFEPLVAVDGRRLVRDHATGLVWQGCAVGTDGADCAEGEPDLLLWYEALGRCEALEWAGFRDWRLPNVKELSTIVDYGRRAPPVDVVAFPRLPGNHVWTSTTRGDRPQDAMDVLFRELGETVALPKRLAWGGAICVRGPD